MATTFVTGVRAWQRKLPVNDLLKDLPEDVTLEQAMVVRQQVLDRFSQVYWVPKRIKEEFEYAETLSEMETAIEAMYDWADEARVWLDN